MKKIMIFVGVVTLIVAIAYAGRAWQTFRVNARTTKFNEDIENLFTGLQKYKETVGSYPVGGNASVVKALQGNNPKISLLSWAAIRPSMTRVNLQIPGVCRCASISRHRCIDTFRGPEPRFDDSTVMEADDFIRSN